MADGPPAAEERRWHCETYVGQFYVSHRHGKGICYCPDGSQLRGAFYLGHVEGYATQEWKDGRTFQGLYKSDERFGPGIESYPDGCQDVGLWLANHLIKLCTEVPGSFSVLDYPEHCRYFDDSSPKKYISVKEDPFLRSYKHLPFDDKDIFPEGVLAYSCNMDHLTLTHSFLEDCDAHYFQNTKELPEEDLWPVANGTPLLVRIQMHAYKHRHCQAEFSSDMKLILRGVRSNYGHPGPRELASKQLIEKAARGDFDGVCAVLRNGLAHPDVADKQGYTALAAAAVHSHCDIVNLLLDSGADVNKCSDEGLSALSMCFILYYPEESFKDNIAERSLHCYQWNKQSEPSEAVSVAGSVTSEQQKRWETIQLLLRRGADPNVSWVPSHLLFFAVKAADAKAVKFLLEKGARADVRLPSKFQGLSPLHIAASIPGEEGVQITEYLLSCALDLDARAEDGNEVYGPDEPQDNEAGLSADVCWQLKNEAGPPQEYFSSYNGPVPEEGGRSALHIACQREGNSEHARDVIRLLLEHKANPNTLWSGHSPLSLAIASGNDLAVVELLKHGADPNLPLSGAVESALCAAVSTTYEHQRTAAQRIALVDKLLEAGADILAPVTLQEGKTKAVGTAVDFAYYKYYQWIQPFVYVLQRTKRGTIMRNREGCPSLSTAISADVLLVSSCHPANAVMRSLLAVRLAEGNPGMNDTVVSAQDCWRRVQVRCFHLQAQQVTKDTKRASFAKMDGKVEKREVEERISLTAVKLGSVPGPFSSPACHSLVYLCLCRTDLDVVVMERLQAAPTQQDRRVVLAEVLPGPPVLLDAYEAAVELGQELELAPGPLSALLRIVRCAVTMCTQTPLPDVEECYAYFSELLLCHAVHHPPVSVAVFGLTQVARITAHLFGTVLRHAKLYAYVLTPEACLDLTLVYVDSPERGPEGQMPTTLPEEQGETTGNPSTEPLLQEAAVHELMQVPAEMHLSKEDVSVSPRASPRSKKHLRRPRGSRQGNKRP